MTSHGDRSNHAEQLVALSIGTAEYLIIRRGSMAFAPYVYSGSAITSAICDRATFKYGPARGAPAIRPDGMLSHEFRESGDAL